MTSFTDWDRKESLVHYGIRGMKWRRRRPSRYVPNQQLALRPITPDQNEAYRQQLTLTAARENQFERTPSRTEERVAKADKEMRRAEAQESAGLDSGMPRFSSEKKKVASGKNRIDSILRRSQPAVKKRKPKRAGAA